MSCKYILLVLPRKFFLFVCWAWETKLSWRLCHVWRPKGRQLNELICMSPVSSNYVKSRKNIPPPNPLCGSNINYKFHFLFQNTLQREVFLKILVLGDLGVGKTSLVRKYANDNNQQSTPDYKVSATLKYFCFSRNVREIFCKALYIYSWFPPFLFMWWVLG